MNLLLHHWKSAIYRGARCTLHRAPSLFSVIAAIGLGALCPVPGAYADGPGTTTGELLKIPVGARAIGMGEAFTGLADDSSSLSWNPAGMAQLQQKEANFMHSSLLEGVHYEYLSFVAPGDAYTFGTSLSYLGYGDIAGYDNAGNSIGDQKAYSMLFSGGIARQITRALSVGVSGEIIRQKLADESAGSFAGNIGALYTLPFHFLDGRYSAGFSALHLGPGLKFVSERDPLPRKFKFGLAASRIKNKPISLTFDVTKPNDNSTYMSFGSEYWLRDLIALRAGYIGSDDEGKGLRLGVGLKLSGVLFDYAYGGFGDFGATHRIGLSLRFGQRITQLNADERAILREAKALRKERDYVQEILRYEELLQRNPNNDRVLGYMISAHQAMLQRELGEAVAQATSELPSPEKDALQGIVPGQEVAGGIGLIDPLGLDQLPDVSDMDTAVRSAAFTPTQKPVIAPTPSKPSKPTQPAVYKAFPDANTNAGSASNPSPSATSAVDDVSTGQSADEPALSAIDIYGN